MVYGESESGKERDDDTALEGRLLVMRANYTMHDGVPNLVLNLHLVHDGTRGSLRIRLAAQDYHPRSDEELVLDVDEMVRHLDGFCDVS